MGRYIANAAIVWLYAAGCVLWAQPPTPLQGFTSGDLHKLKSVGTVSVSPDGTHIVYSIRSNEGPGSPASTFWLSDVASGKQVQVGNPMGSPRWSPDGGWIAFLGRVGDRNGLVRRRLEETGFGDPEFIAPVSGTNHPLPHNGESIAWEDWGQIWFFGFFCAPKKPKNQI